LVEISVVVPAWNAEKTLSATLSGLAGQRFDEEFEVIVVDDGSTDRTRALAERSAVVTRVLDGGRRGPAAARNLGAASAQGSILAFLDADCTPSPGWLAAGREALKNADLVLGETRPDPGEPLGPFDRTLWVIGLSPLFESANMFVRRELFQALRGFEGWLGPRNGKELGEDVWFGWRARRGGARVVASPVALAHHAVFPRSPVEFIAERWRLRFFPAMARRVPELRREFFYRRLFLNKRAAAFDAAAAAMAIALMRRNGAAIFAALPYTTILRDDIREGRARDSGGLKLAGARLAADAVGAAAMLYGSARSRSLLL